MATEKHLTTSDEAKKFETDPDYVTKDIVIENGKKYGIFEKIGSEPVKEKPVKEKEK